MKKTLLFLGVACAMIIASCNPDEPKPEVKAEITAVSALIAETDDTSATFTLTTTREWSIASEAEWIKSITPSTGDAAVENETVTIAFDANKGELRTATITITSVDQKHDISLSQAAAAPAAVLGQVYLMKATLAEDPAGFNMLSDAGFEDYPEEAIGYFTPWWCADSHYTTDAPHSGKRACGLDLNSISSNIGFQTLAARPYTDYVISAWMKSNQDTGAPDTYLGIRKGVEGRPVLKDVNKAMNFTTSWSEQTVDFNTAENPLIEAFAFAFQKEGYVVYWDDICVKRADDTQKSYLLKDVTSLGSVFKDMSGLTSSDGMIAWDGGDGQTMLAFGECIGIGDETTRSNALAISTDTNLGDGITATVVKDGTQAKELITPATGEKVLPTAGISVGKRQYIHYQKTTNKLFAEPIWTVSQSGLAYSDDNGSTWNVSDVVWGANSNFAQVALLKDNGYVYMYGSSAGRRIEGGEQYIRLARAAESDLLTQSAWKYWNGTEWVAEENAAVPVVYGGTVGEISVVKNATTNRFMMLYMSVKRNAIVARDAAAPEGEWSGEKIVLSDTASEILASPSFHALGASGNDIYFFVSSAWGK